MKFIILRKADLKLQNLTLLVNTIYNNFIELEDIPLLSHNKETISANMYKDSILILAMENDKICGYLLGYYTTLPDNRQILFINYIYLSKKYRHKGIGRKLMFSAIDDASEHKVDGVMLIYDTDNLYVDNFYKKLGFMLDVNMRRFHRHDVFYRIITS
jgi:ribosomal protein S18 acetylase RimI-like enzyme